jgi:hypothetical protein
MPKRYWLPLIAVVGLLGSVHAQTVSHDTRGNTAAHKRQSKPKADTPPAIPVAIQDAIKRIPGALEAANNHPYAAEERQRSKDNLKAEQDTVFWAFMMFLVALLETLVTAAGVFLVWRTLIASREAAGHAKRAADAAENSYTSLERPHLFPEGPRLDPVTVKRIYAGGTWMEPPLFRAFFDITNYGRSPAIIRQSSATIFIGESLPENPQIPPGDIFTESLFPIGADKTKKEWIAFYRGSLTDELIIQLQEGRTATDMGYKAFLFVQLRYDSVNGKTDSIGLIWEYLIDVRQFVPRQIPNYSYRILGP